MTDAIADAPVRANRPADHASESPLAANAGANPQRSDDAAHAASTGEQFSGECSQAIDERDVARVAAHLVRELIEDDERCIGLSSATVYSSELTRQALAQLERLTPADADADADAADVFHAAAAMVSGALALDLGEKPDQLMRHGKLTQVFQVLNSASISYGFVQEPCEALAVGLRAGAKQFPAQPRPPIRRVQDEAGSDDTLNHQQQKSVLQTLAGYASTLEQVLMAAQTSEDDYQTGVLVDSAVLLARYVGGLADNASGGGVCGNHDHWNYGPNFATEGKAGAA